MRRVSSRALRAASRARAASTILPQMILASAGCSSRNSDSLAETSSCDDRHDFGRNQLVLGLRAELGLGHLDRQHAGEALAHVVAGGLDLRLLRDLFLLDVVVERPRHRLAQPGQVGAAVALRDVVGEALDVLGVRVVPLHRHLDGDAVALGDAVEDLRMQHALAAVHVLDEALDAARVREVLALAVALVGELDLDAVVQERKLADALGEDLVVELDAAERLGRRHEVHFGAAPVGGAGRCQRRHRLAAAEFHLVDLAVAPDAQLQPVGQRVDHRHADAVQAAGHLVAVLVELAAGVQLGHHDLGGGTLELVVVLDVGRDAAAVVDHRDRVVGVDDDLDLVAVPGQRLVDRVVEDFEHHVVQAGAVGRVADVHARALAHRVEALEDLDAVGVVVAAGVGSGLQIALAHRGFRWRSIAPKRRRRPLVVGAVTARRWRQGSGPASVRCASASRRTCSRRGPAR